MQKCHSSPSAHGSTKLNPVENQWTVKHPNTFSSWILCVTQGARRCKRAETVYDLGANYNRSKKLQVKPNKILSGETSHFLGLSHTFQGEVTTILCVLKRSENYALWFSRVMGQGEGEKGLWFIFSPPSTNERETGMNGVVDKWEQLKSKTCFPCSEIALHGSRGTWKPPLSTGFNLRPRQPWGIVISAASNPPESWPGDAWRGEGQGRQEQYLVNPFP